MEYVKVLRSFKYFGNTNYLIGFLDDLIRCGEGIFGTTPLKYGGELEVIQTKNLSKIYGSGNTAVRALDGIDLTVEQGDFIAIRGPSGCGKSTLLNIIGCLESPTSGEILIDGIDVSQLNDNELAKIRRDKIGFVFQSYNLIPTLNALENVKLPMIFAGGDDSKLSERAKMLLELVGMKERMEHKPSELSGGEQQRVAIARALSNDPALIIGDEPTGNLDSKTGNVVMNLLNRLNKEGQTLIIVTHNPAVANMAHGVMQMKDGQFIDEEPRMEGEI
ncbi:MAG: ABC transporter ATP-binding protein [Methanosarcinales archaeon Met12]|nr:MAG: ABC transporter ATP-binding protein [Methanosarcinales archaeon Met12]